jgi:hypothetical protein
MKLQITKNNSKKHIVLYQRDDGSETWMHADDFFVHHDLSHYAIEKTLGYKTAFMGMLNNGMEIKDFENREKRKQIAIIKEAVYAENMANLFLMEIAQGSFEDFNKILQDSFKPMETNLSAPVLTEKEISSVRKYLSQLIAAWKELAAGERICLEYES